MRPLLYISYGMAKSGSTLGFKLACAVLEEAGVPQSDLDLRTEMGGDHARFVEVIRPRELGILRRIAEARPRAPIVVKTHGGLWKCVEKGLAEGWIVGHAIARDPRDMALSMLDAAHDGRAWGARDGRPHDSADDTLQTIRSQVEKFLRWAQTPGVLPLAYEPLAFATEDAAAAVAGQLGLEIDTAQAARAAKRQETNFNAGRSHRFETEMSAETSARIHAEFAEFIRDWCAPDFIAPKRSLLTRLTGG